jgi:glucose-1-phosphate thymidylyltransferase
MIVGLVPAAGHATRLGSLPSSKELLSVGGRPVMDYVVERMRLAHADEIRVVTRPDKEDVVEHARSLGATVVEGRPSTPAASVRLGLESLVPDDIVLLGFPDSVWEPADGFATLVTALDERTEVVLGCFASADLERSDVVVLERDRVVRVDVKPAAPPSDAMWGCCAARAGALDGLDRYDEPGHLLDALARGGRVRGVRFDTEFVDIGTPEALARVGALT